MSAPTERESFDRYDRTLTLAARLSLLPISVLVYAFLAAIEHFRVLSHLGLPWSFFFVCGASAVLVVTCSALYDGVMFLARRRASARLVADRAARMLAAW